jgi:hypothetical protein
MSLCLRASVRIADSRLRGTLDPVAAGGGGFRSRSGYLLSGGDARRSVVSEEFRENEQTRAAGEKSERLLEDTYLSGAVGMGA